ncbi:hypothetical protein [Cellulomonas shaoxiangyii]|uniref:DUF4872 domain-containing protein n=1 Tax=Cellulomonas shaoxiangyii TaxID=2566013 RepID=A0A4P7SQH2_9CELL|nr:hypothetical protein [Cellulomonas shaoxiangyii]QCB95013.1 hypothetical protein E5225_17035 [Cellulomonas shaoxiangyii]TGY86342.1 hypothetical protein E5226_02120 [Cellulomonas shaoxiangyii]
MTAPGTTTPATAAPPAVVGDVAEVVPTRVGPVLRLAATDRIANADPAMYLECRQRQALSYLRAVTASADLLKYRALGSTAEFHRHCAIQQQPRWTMSQDLCGPEDLAALGYEVQLLGHADLGLLPRLRELVQAGQPVTFYAPAEDVGYWADLLRRRGRPDGGGRGAHGVLVCGVSLDGEWLVTPDTTDEGPEFRTELLSVAGLRVAAAADPEGWFVDALSLRRAAPAQPDVFADRYREMVTGLQDGFEAYEALPQLLAADRARRPDLDQQVASTDLLRMLAGSRGLFSQFVRNTSHSGPAVATYRALGVSLSRLLGRAMGYVAGDGPADLGSWRRDLRTLRTAEVTGLRRLKDELAAGPVSVALPAERDRPTPPQPH